MVSATMQHGRPAMDHSYDVMESSNNLIVHGQLMPFEHCPDLDLHVWNGMLNPRIVQVRGEHCQFVTLQSNVENRWYQQTSTLKALAEWCNHFCSLCSAHCSTGSLSVHARCGY